MDYIWQKFLNVESTPVIGEYHSNGRPDLVGMFRGQPRNAVDVGCATGENGLLIKQKFPNCSVWGVETNRAAAAVASGRLDRVLVGKMEDFNLEELGLKKGELDAVLFADVLEHMYDPWRTMVSVREYLSDDGEVVISIPNIRNLTVLVSLVGGTWDYESQGLLDITHIRFFTKTTFERLISETGYIVEAVEVALDGRLTEMYSSAKEYPLTINGGKFSLSVDSPQEWVEWCAVQFYYKVKKHR